MRLLLVCALIAAAGSAEAANRLTWGSVVTRTAQGCDAITPVRGPDGHHYTSFGDCNGLTGTLTKLSMGLGRIIGGPASAQVQDLPTPSLADFGNREQGQKPSSVTIIGSRMYVWVTNYGLNGTESRLKYSDDFMRSSGSAWTWAPFHFYNISYPVFVQGVVGSYVYLVAHDNLSEYKPADRYMLMRVPSGKLLDRLSYEWFSGTPTFPAWTKGFTPRNKARGRYYWWQNNGNSKITCSFEVWSGKNPWGPWQRLFYTLKWDVNPGERGEFPVSWMGSETIDRPGTLYLVYSGGDRLNIRKATVAAGY